MARPLLGNAARLPIPRASKRMTLREVPMYPLDGGLVSERQSEALQRSQSPRLRDVLFHQGELRKAQGWSQLGANLIEPVRYVSLWERATGALTPFAISTTDLYTFDGTTWSKIAPTASLTSSERWGAVVFDDILYFVSPQNVIRKYTGSGSHAAVAGGFKAKTLEVINSHIVLASTESGGTAEPYTLRWTQNGSDSFTGVGSGAIDLIERDDFIKNLGKAGPYRAFVYKGQSIVEMRATGDSLLPFEFSEIVGGTGLLAPFTLVSQSFGQFFIGSDEHIYFFDYSNITPIDADIRREFFSSFDQSRLDLASAIFNPETSEYVVFLPTVGSTAADLFYAYDAAARRWRSGRYNRVRHASLIRAAAGIRWNEDTTTWTAETNTWNFFPFSIARRSVAIATDNNKVFTLDSGVRAFDGTALQFSYETPDIVGETHGEEITLTGVTICYVVDGTATLTVDISRDKGGSFTDSKSVALGGGSLVNGDVAYAEASFMKTGQNVRIRVRNSVSTEIVRLKSITALVSASGTRRKEATT